MGPQSSMAGVASPIENGYGRSHVGSARNSRPIAAWPSKLTVVDRPQTAATASKSRPMLLVRGVMRGRARIVQNVSSWPAVNQRPAIGRAASPRHA